jgi:hypothetical protein
VTHPRRPGGTLTGRERNERCGGGPGLWDGRNEAAGDAVIWRGGSLSQRLRGPFREDVDGQGEAAR